MSKRPDKDWKNFSENKPPWDLYTEESFEKHLKKLSDEKKRKETLNKPNKDPFTEQPWYE